MMFNVNHNVRVKLTDAGRAALKKNHKQLFGEKVEHFKFQPPKEDANGWSEWQLWSLMRDLGPHITMGFSPPFETTIEICEPAPEFPNGERK